MSELREKPNKLKDYPYHLPDKPFPAGPYITYEEFFDWTDEDTHAEWVDGEIVMPSPATEKHQETVGFLYEVLRIYMRVKNAGRVFQAPFQMKLPGKHGSGREPDLVFIAKNNLSRLETGLIRGPGDIVIEVVSLESVERDRVDKYKEYAAGGVPEYWLIDVTIGEAEFYCLDANNQYQRVPIDHEGKFHSQILPDFWLKPEWLWEAPLPEPEDILFEIAEPAYSAYLNNKLQRRKK